MKQDSFAVYCVAPHFNMLFFTVYLQYKYLSYQAALSEINKGRT